MSHDINSDPEVWELTDTFGDWLLYAWLQILSVADRGEGEYRGTPTAIATTLSHLSRGTRRDRDAVRRRFKGTNIVFRMELALYWMTLRHWLLPIVLTEQGEKVLESWPNHSRMVVEWSPNGHRIIGEWWPNGYTIIGFKTRNYSKYHKTREREKVPSEPSEPSNTNTEDGISPFFLDFSRSSGDVNNGAKRGSDFALPSFIDSSTWGAFEEVRRKMKAPLTDHGRKLIIAKLTDFQQKGDDPNECIDQSILNGWRGVFSLKKNNGGTKKRGFVG